MHASRRGGGRVARPPRPSPALAGGRGADSACLTRLRRRRGGGAGWGLVGWVGAVIAVALCYRTAHARSVRRDTQPQRLLWSGDGVVWFVRLQCRVDRHGRGGARVAAAFASTPARHSAAGYLARPPWPLGGDRSNRGGRSQPPAVARPAELGLARAPPSNSLRS